MPDRQGLYAADGSYRVTNVGDGVAADGSQSVTVASSEGVTLTDASISSATGASQTIAALSTTRTVLNVSNNAATTWWINESGGTAAANGTGCFELPAGQRWTPRPAPLNVVTAIGTAASKLTVVTG
jgi:hypothetical protein